MVIILILIAIFTYIFLKFKAILRQQTKELQYKSDTRLDGKTILITGATSGIGKATALELASYGARVILACRNRQKADVTCKEIRQETGNDNIIVVDLDLSDLDSVKSAAEEVKKSESRLDVLINNAAIGVTDDESSKQGYDLTFATNYIGHFLLTHLLLDLIKQSAPSRIINVSSKMNEILSNKLNFCLYSEDSTIKYSNLKGYTISKLANIYHSRFLSEELSGSRVTINAMHPGFVGTDIMKKHVKNPIKNIINKMCELMAVYFSRSPKEAAQTLVYMAVDRELTEVTGEYFENVSIKTCYLTSLALDKEQARKMREISFLACKDYLDLPKDIAKVEDSVEKEEKCADEGFLPSRTKMKAYLEHLYTSLTSYKSSKPAKTVEEAPAVVATAAAAPATTAAAAAPAAVATAAAATTAATTAAAAAATEAAAAATTAAATTATTPPAAETVSAATAATTKLSSPESNNASSKSNVPASPYTFAPLLETDNKRHLLQIENLTSHTCSSTNKNIETTQESIYKPLILPEITEANEHYPPADDDSNLNWDTTNVCSDRMSSSREDSPLIVLDDSEKSDSYREEETL